MAVLVLVGCSNGGTSSGGVETAPLTYVQVNTIVQNQNNPEVVRQADYDEKEKYGWAKCKVKWVYVYTNKTVVYTSGCGYSYFLTTRVRFRSALADVATQAKVRNKVLNFWVTSNSWTHFAL